jgi:drug/metabolite transporter (DMT)-like permease
VAADNSAPYLKASTRNDPCKMPPADPLRQLRSHRMNTRSWLAFAALGLIWGLPYFLIKVAVQEVAPFVLAWARLTVAALILLPIAWQRGALRGLMAHSGALLAFAVLEFVIPFSAISFGERWISSSTTAILIATVPIAVVLLSRFFALHEPLGVRRLMGLLIGFAGVIALVGFGPITGLRGWAGVGCMLLATLGYALGPLIIQRYLQGMRPIGPMAVSIAMAALLLLPAALATWPAALPSPAVCWSLLALGAVCTALAMLLMFYLINAAGASRASLITYVNPAVAALLGVGILHERLGLGGLMAFVLILLGTWQATHGGVSRVRNA